jgi:hypothetical protein
MSGYEYRVSKDEVNLGDQGKVDPLGNALELSQGYLVLDGRWFSEERQW